MDKGDFKLGGVNEKLEAVESASVEIQPTDPPCTMTFWSEKNKQVGKLEFADGVMKFTGNMKPSAKVFFDWLIFYLVGPYIERRIKKIIEIIQKQKDKPSDDEAAFDKGWKDAADYCIKHLKKEFKI